MLRCGVVVVNANRPLPAWSFAGNGEVPNRPVPVARDGQSWERLVGAFAALPASAIRHRYRLA